MRSAVIFFAGLAAVAQAAIDPSAITQIPTCAQQPLIQGIANSGCTISDSDCICENEELLSKLQEAVKANCSPEDQAKTLTLTAAICPSLASDAASSAASVATSAESAASSLSSVAEAATTATAAITTDSGSLATVASNWPVGTGTSTVNYTATTGEYTPPTTPTITAEQTGAAAQSFALGSVVLGIGALGLLFAGL